MNSHYFIVPEDNNEEDKIFGIFLKNRRDLYTTIVYTPRESFAWSRRSEKTKERISTASFAKEPSFPPKKTPVVSISQKFLISHDSKWKSGFDLIVLILVNISSLIILYEVSFEEEGVFSDLLINDIIEILFCIYIILQFFQKYQNRESLLVVTSYKKIALHYMRRWFFFDLISIFPFQIFSIKNHYIKLIRLFRLPKLFETIDMGRFDNLLSTFYSKSEKSENGTRGLLLIFNIRYIFKIIRLIFMAFIVTYLLGCLWYVYCTYIDNIIPLIYQDDKTERNSFIKQYFTETYIESSGKLLFCMYFVLTTLTTVGFGDVVPQNIFERILTIVIMVLGVAIFSYVMSSITDQISVYNQSFGGIDKGSHLESWLNLLQRYSRDKPFNINLIKSIDSHFKFFWRNDRVGSIDMKNTLLKKLPKDIILQLIDYLWLEVYTRFSLFFQYKKYKEKFFTFYYELSFIILPRIFTEGEIIYEIDSDVEEMYFIIKGGVNVGYSYEVDGIKNIKNYLEIISGDFFGGYYTLYNVQSEFVYSSVKESIMFGINKIDLLKLLKKYPEISREMRINCYNKYKNRVKRELDIEILNESNKLGLQQYQSKELVHIDSNWNGMTVNNMIKEKIEKKEREIEVKMDKLSNRFKELEDKRKVANEGYLNLFMKCGNEGKIITSGIKLNIEEEFLLS